MSVVSQDERCVKFWLLLEIFNFGRNSWVLKVLAHEKSDEIKKNLKSSIFMVLRRGLLIKLSQDECCKNLLVMLEILNFWVEILEFKVLAHEKGWLNPNKN